MGYSRAHEEVLEKFNLDLAIAPHICSKLPVRTSHLFCISNVILAAYQQLPMYVVGRYNYLAYLLSTYNELITGTTSS